MRPSATRMYISMMDRRWAEASLDCPVQYNSGRQPAPQLISQNDAEGDERVGLLRVASRLR